MSDESAEGILLTVEGKNLAKGVISASHTFFILAGQIMLYYRIQDGPEVDREPGKDRALSASCE